MKNPALALPIDADPSPAEASPSLALAGDEAAEAEGTGARLKALMKRYGGLAVAIHLSIFWVTWVAFAGLIAAGFDLGAGAGAGLVGLFAAAYVPTQLTKPPRVLLTLALTPAVARRLGR